MIILTFEWLAYIYHRAIIMFVFTCLFHWHSSKMFNWILRTVYFISTVRGFTRRHCQRVLRSTVNMYYATLFVFGVSTLFPLTVVAATEMDTACVCVCVYVSDYWHPQTSLKNHRFWSMCLCNLSDTFLVSAPSLHCIVLFPSPLFVSLLSLMHHIFSLIFLSIPLRFLLLVGAYNHEALWIHLTE
jgi:hypothetical protein